MCVALAPPWRRTRPGAHLRMETMLPIAAEVCEEIALSFGVQVDAVVDVALHFFMRYIALCDPEQLASAEVCTVLLSAMVIATKVCTSSTLLPPQRLLYTLPRTTHRCGPAHNQSSSVGMSSRLLRSLTHVHPHLSSLPPRISIKVHNTFERLDVPQLCDLYTVAGDDRPLTARERVSVF